MVTRDWELLWFLCLIKFKVGCHWAKELKGKWETHCALLQNRAKSHLRKEAWEHSNRRSLVNCKQPLKNRINSFQIDKPWIVFNYLAVHKSRLGARAENEGKIKQDRIVQIRMLGFSGTIWRKRSHSLPSSYY